MKIKDLFTVPPGEKVTEKHLRRVLISSVCSILLCMTCLVSTTWAWFTVSIENTGNAIWVAIPAVSVEVNGAAVESGVTLGSGVNTVKISHGNTADDLDRKSVLYVILTVKGSSGSTTTKYTVLNHENGYIDELTVNAAEEAVLRWEVSWFAPSTTEPVSGGVIATEVAVPTGPSNDATGESETAAPDTTGPTETPTETPTEKPTEAPTETLTEAPTEAPTEAGTELETE